MKKLLLSVLIACGLIFPGSSAYAMQGMYHNYDPQSFAAASNDTRVLFFHAPWCPMCRNDDAMLQKTPLPEGVMVYKVDFDNAADLRKQYGVVMQDTFVLVDARGKKAAQWVGFERAMADHFMAPDKSMMKKSDDTMEHNSMMMKK